MSISKRWVADPKNVALVLAQYRTPESPTVEKIAKGLGTTYHNVLHVLKANVPPAEYKALQAIRYSRSKKGENSPHFGKRGPDAPRWKGAVDDGYGYLTLLKDGKRQFVHRIVMAEALGIKTLPEIFDVHHIDDNKKNNKLDNLALVTRAGHKTIHYLQVKDSLSVALKKSKLREALQFLTSPSMKTKAI